MLRVHSLNGAAGRDNGFFSENTVVHFLSRRRGRKRDIGAGFAAVHFRPENTGRNP